MGARNFGEAGSYLCPNKFCVTMKTEEWVLKKTLVKTSVIFLLFKKKVFFKYWYNITKNRTIIATHFLKGILKQTWYQKNICFFYIFSLPIYDVLSQQQSQTINYVHTGTSCTSLALSMPICDREGWPGNYFFLQTCFRLRQKRLCSVESHRMIW